MFGDLLGAAEHLLGGVSAQDVGDVTADHVASMDAGSLVQHLVGSLGNLSDDAQNPEALKGAVVSFVQQNPQILQQFAPEFLKGILSKLSG